MVTIEGKQNVYLNSVKHTVFVIRENGVYRGEFSVKHWNASDAACLQSYNTFLEESLC